jgi:large subunit ribosomal protein L35
MERLYQMHVIPDILPVLEPSVDLRVVLPEATSKGVLRARAKRKTSPVEAGVFLVNEQVYMNTWAVYLLVLTGLR